MKKWLHSILHFSKKERWGIYTLCVVCLLAWLIPAFFSHPIIQEDDLDIEIIDLEMKRKKIILAHSTSVNHSFQKYAKFKTREAEQKPPQMLFDFDPNQIGKETWMKLGLEERRAAGVVKYIEKGGRFRKKEDLKKIYGMTDALYEALAPHVVLKEQANNAVADIHVPALKKIQKIDLNQADSIELLSLPGIGEKLASRIIRFREKLGGFANTDQLADVYGIDPNVLTLLRSKVVINNPTEIKKLQVNEVSLDELKKHPYAGYVNSKLIIAYRTVHGHISNATELLSIGEIDKVKIEKLIPYLIF